MLFNRGKFELLKFQKSARKFYYETPQRKKIEANRSVRDLRIISEPNGNFDKHITSVVVKRKRMIGWILRTFRTRTKEIMLTLLKKFVVPKVRYGCIIWMPTSQNSVNLTESIQRRFTKMIGCFQTYDDNLQMPITTTNYHEWLKNLYIYSLQSLREQNVIIYIYKIVIQLVKDPGL